jgi:hypothetical protein
MSATKSAFVFNQLLRLNIQLWIRGWKFKKIFSQKNEIQPILALSIHTYKNNWVCIKCVSFCHQKNSQKTTQKENLAEKNEPRHSGQTKLNLESSIALYKKLILEGPTEVCTCCGCLYFPIQVKKISCKSVQKAFEKYSPETPNFRTNINFLEEFDSICTTCAAYAVKGKYSKLSLCNGHRFPVIPPELLGLTRIEEMMVAARILFIKIYAVAPQRQFKQSGIVLLNLKTL